MPNPVADARTEADRLAADCLLKSGVEAPYTKLSLAILAVRAELRALSLQLDRPRAR